MTVNKKIQYKQNLSLLLACLSLLIFGGCALYENGGITYTSIMATGIKIIPAIAAMYALGWLIGCVLESSTVVKKAKSIGYTNSLLEEILKEEGLDNIENEDFMLDESDLESKDSESP